MGDCAHGHRGSHEQGFAESWRDLGYGHHHPEKHYDPVGQVSHSPPAAANKLVVVRVNCPFIDRLGNLCATSSPGKT